MRLWTPMEEVEDPADGGKSADAPAAKDDKEAKRLAKVIEKLQKDSEEKDRKLAELATKHERDKLEEGERLKLELEDLRKTAATLAREKEELAARQTRREMVWELVSEHGLLATRFGDVLLADYDPEKTSLEDFVKKAKKDKDLKVLFRAEADSGVADTPPIHGAPASRSRKNTDGVTDEDKETAKRLFPHDALKQEKFLARLKTSERGK